MPNSSNSADLVDQFRILAASGNDLRVFCSSFDIDIEAVAGRIGIDVASFDDFEARISFQRFCQLLNILASKSKEDAFGLRYGLFSKRGATGPFGFGLASAPNFKSMLNFYANYIHTVVDIHSFNVVFKKDKFSIDWTYSPLISGTEHYADFAATIGLRVFQQFLGGPVVPLHVQLQRSSPLDNSLHIKTFSKHIEFNAKINSFVFSAQLLERKNPSGDGMMFSHWSRQCDSISCSMRREKDIVTTLKEDIINNLESRDNLIGDVAHRMGLSERTLQRRLSDLGTGFWELFDKTRDEQSMRMLKDTDLSLLEIGHNLGYSSQSAYTRTVKRLHGTTPSQLRAAIKNT